MFTETDESIYTGMFAELSIKISDKNNILLLPIEGLIKEGGLHYVYKVMDDVAVKTQIATGIRTNTHIEIAGDLSEGDIIVLEGKEFLKDGSKVMIK